MNNMLYNSTQNAGEVVSSAQAIAQGISKDGGLFVPQEFPKLSEADFQALLNTDYKGRAKLIFSAFLTDFSAEEISDCVEKAYTAEKFGGSNPAPLAYTALDGNELNILELWHGPTCAFKDMALQILPHLLTKSLKKPTTARMLLFWLRPPAIPERQPWRALRTLTIQKSLFSIPSTA